MHYIGKKVQRGYFSWKRSTHARRARSLPRSFPVSYPPSLLRIFARSLPFSLLLHSPSPSLPLLSSSLPVFPLYILGPAPPFVCIAHTQSTIHTTHTSHTSHRTDSAHITRNTFADTHHCYSHCGVGYVRDCVCDVSCLVCVMCMMFKMLIMSVCFAYFIACRAHLLYDLIHKSSSTLSMLGRLPAFFDMRHLWLAGGLR